MPGIEKAGAVFGQEGVQFLPQQGTYMVNAAMMLGFAFSYALGEIMPTRENPDRLRRFKRGSWKNGRTSACATTTRNLIGQTEQ